MAIGFGGLPLEVLGLIFDQLESVEDAIHLGLCSQWLWPAARRYIKRYFYSFFGEWVDTKVICVGCGTESYPPVLLTEADMKELERGLSKYESYHFNDDDTDDDEDKPFPTLLSYLADRRYTRLRSMSFRYPEPRLNKDEKLPEDFNEVVYPNLSKLYDTSVP